MSSHPSSICIIAQNAYGALTGGRDGHVGGAEHQTAFLARWLAAQGHTVSLICWDEGQPGGVEANGVRVIKMCSKRAGLPGLRFFHPRLTSIAAALRAADADVYYHNAAECVTGIVAAWCRRHGRKLVYSVASEVACDARLPAMPKRYERVLYRHGLRHAHKIIVQTERQRELLQDGFGLGSVILPMPCPGPSEAEYSPVVSLDKPSVAWVGRAASMKRLEWMLEIASRMPEVRFDLAVADNAGNGYADQLHARALKLSNVTWRGPVKRAAMPDVYRGNACLCCTSSYEGFPNTFLEAWSHGRPVVTSFDPDGLVARCNLGMVANTVDEFVASLRELLTSREFWVQKSNNARRYYLDNHVPEKVMPMIETEILSTLAGKDRLRTESSYCPA